GETQEYIAHDVLGIFSVFKNAMEGELSDEDSRNKRNYIVAEITPEKRAYIEDDAKAMLLLVVQPKYPAQSASFSRRIMEKIRQITGEEVEAGMPPAQQERVRIEYGGGYEIATKYRSRVNETLFGTLITSLIGVVALFGYCFRRYGVLLYIGVPLVMVVSWTIGLGWIVFGQLNIVSCAFAAVLVGLGVDYAIHIYNRYVEERSAGASVEEAFVTSLTQTGWAVFIGMATTSLAFLALKATRFTQLSQFGVLAGLGIALSVPGMLFVLPSLIALRNSFSKEHARTLRPTTFFLPQIAVFVEKRRKFILAVTVIIAIVCGLQLAFKEDALSFNENISSLRPKDRSFELGGEIARIFSKRNPNKLMLLAYGDTEEKALERASELEKGCQELMKEGLLVNYESAMRYLPAPSKQKERLAFLKTIDFEKALADFRAELAKQGLSEESFYLTIKLLKEHAALVSKGEIILPSMFYNTPVGKWAQRLVTRRRTVLDLREPIPENIQFPVELAKPAVDRNDNVRYPAGAMLTREQLVAIGPDGELAEGKGDGPGGKSLEYTWTKRITVIAGGWTVKSNIFPPIVNESKTADLKIDDEWLKEVRHRLGLVDNDEDGEKSKAFLTGTSLLAHELAGVVKTDFWHVSVAVFAVAAMVLTFFFHRHPPRVLYSLLPIVLGLLFLFGLMSFGKIEFNFINVLAIPILIGLGVDNGIHLVERFYESGRRIRPMIGDTGRAIMITTLTSMVGFGSLAAPQYVPWLPGGYRGVSSMGILSILALFCSLVASIIVFPAILRTFSPPDEAPENKELDRD
ncbi:MAG: MMPL family transporter, partial [Planctomycetes bacterium]|nr:MMPL family transporter [Planctomycetota bacterium]